MQQEFIKKATALNYEQGVDSAPKVIAQGSRQTAHTIIKIAQENGIPIKKDEDMVQMLSQIELNQEIPVELYKAVAEVFSFIYGISNNQGEKREKKD